MSLGAVLITTAETSIAVPGGVTLRAEYDRLKPLLQSRLGQVHADLFAIPTIGPSGILWAAPLPGPAVPVLTLDLARRAALLRRIGTLIDDIRRLADRLSMEPGPSRQFVPSLRRIARDPAPDLVWLVGDQPIIAGWNQAPPASGNAAGGIRVGGSPKHAPGIETPTRRRGAARAGMVLLPLGLIGLPLLILPVLVWLLLQPAPVDGQMLAALRRELAGLPDPTHCHKEPVGPVNLSPGTLDAP